MLTLRILALLAAALLPLPSVAEVVDNGAELRLFIPVNPVGISFSKDDWTIQKEKRKSGGMGAYYLMYSGKRLMNFSVYIEKSTACSSADACLDATLKNKMYDDAQDMQRATVGPFKAAFFYLDKPMGQQLYQSNLQASALVDGIWFDVHLSMVGKERPDVNLLLEFLKTVTIQQSNP